MLEMDPAFVAEGSTGKFEMTLFQIILIPTWRLIRQRQLRMALQSDHNSSIML
jgi:hypothetical protein